VSFLILDSSATLAWIYGDEITEATVPLYRVHHRVGDEVAWWERRAIDPITTARVLRISTRCIE